MKTKKRILAIVGSSKENSTNLRIVNVIAKMVNERFSFIIFDKLATLPHFNPDLDSEKPPKRIATFRKKIEQADGVIICTPEYVFSLPGSLKNALEWTVSTVVFSEKPVGLITAAASGEKAHEALELIMNTLGAKFNQETRVLISGVKGKLEGNVITDDATIRALKKLIKSLTESL